MKTIFIFAIAFINVQLLKAATFECQTFLNLDVISAQVVKTEVRSKVEVDNTDVARSYLTQKENNVFLLEAYLPQHDMRIYSEAAVIEKNTTITVSVWSHDDMIDVVCRKLD